MYLLGREGTREIYVQLLRVQRKIVRFFLDSKTDGFLFSF